MASIGIGKCSADGEMKKYISEQPDAALEKAKKKEKDTIIFIVVELDLWSGTKFIKKTSASAYRKKWNFLNIIRPTN